DRQPDREKGSRPPRGTDFGTTKCAHGFLPRSSSAETSVAGKGLAGFSPADGRERRPGRVYTAGRSRSAGPDRRRNRALQPQLRPAHAPGHVLLVADDPTSLDLVRGMLDGRGYRLFTAQTGADAVTVARLARPWLVLLEAAMAGVDGYETCR